MQNTFRNFNDFLLHEEFENDVTVLINNVHVRLRFDSTRFLCEDGFETGALQIVLNNNVLKGDSRGRFKINGSYFKLDQIIDYFWEIPTDL